MKEKAVFDSKMGNHCALALLPKAFVFVGVSLESQASAADGKQSDTAIIPATEEPLSKGQKEAWHEMLYGGIVILSIFIIFIYFLYRKSRKQK